MLKRSFSIIFIAILLINVFCFGESSWFGINASAASWSVGDIIEYGMYPQSRVLDPLILPSLNKASSKVGWCDYEYFVGDGPESWGEGTMHTGEYMYFCDIQYEGHKYRGVKFSQYRPWFTDYTSDYSYQDNNSFKCNETYWFKFEPIKWRILDLSSGLVVSDKILDSQAFNNYFIYNEKDGELYCDSAKKEYAGLFEYSDIRTWLNVDFYVYAFESSDTDNIKYTTLDNTNMIGTKGGDVSYINGSSTTDKIFLLSYADVQNKKYGFDSVTAKGTYYAASQGLHVFTKEEINNPSEKIYENNSPYRLRTPMTTDSARTVNYNGELNALYGVNDTSVGIRPAMCLKQIKSEAAFTVGRDNNSYSHGQFYSTSGFYKVKNYNISDKSLSDKLKKLAKKGDKITDEMNNKWNGSCYGIAATMGLAFIRHLPTVNKRTSYYNMPLPWEDSDFLDSIQYYQLSQYVSAYQEYNHTFWNPTKYIDQSDFKSLSSFFDYLLKTINDYGIAQFSYGHGSGENKSGHSIIAYGVTTNTDGSYSINIYDENNNKDTTIELNANKNKFSFVDGNRNPIDQTQYNYLECYNLYDYLQAERSTKSSKLKVADNASLYSITISSCSDFTIKDADGKTLSYYDGLMESNMDIVDMNPVVKSGDGESAEYDYVLTVRSSPDIEFMPSGKSEISVYNDESYFRLRSENIDSASIHLGDNVTISGESCSYDTAFGFNETDDSLYWFSATQKADTSIAFSDNKVEILSDKSLTNVCLEKVAEDEIKERYNSNASNQISVLNDERVYDGEKLVYTPYANVPSVSIHNYTSDLTVKCATEVRFYADVMNAPEGSVLEWYGLYKDEQGEAQITTIKCDIDQYAGLIVTTDYELYVKLIAKDGTVLAVSQPEKIHMKSPRLFPILINLIRLLFARIGIRKKYVQ